MGGRGKGSGAEDTIKAAQGKGERRREKEEEEGKRRREAARSAAVRVAFNSAPVLLGKRFFGES